MSATAATDPAGTEDERTRVFFDVSVCDEPVGRLVFRLAPDALLPLHVENVRALCSGARRPIDPKATYRGCAFEHSPAYVEGLGQYRWSHVLKGFGRNAVGRPTEPLGLDAETQQRCTQTCFGGTYYGEPFELELPAGDEEGDSDPGVALVVPLAGPGRGSSRIAIVRVGESPQEWRERLLLNSVVVGRLESGIETLWRMARQKSGPPIVTEAGVV